MSILIKGIDLPKEKDEALLLLILGDGTVAEKIDSDRYEEITNTQAIQIPTPHGRIVDLEKLKEEFAMKKNICKECDSFKECDNKTYSKSEICENFIWVPTIIEAEE